MANPFTFGTSGFGSDAFGPVPGQVTPSTLPALPPIATGPLVDLYHYWGNDLIASGTGDLQTVNGTTRGQQRVLRRLLTNPASATTSGDYIFEPTYGAGLPAFIGQPIDKQKIQAAIRAQMLLEQAVAQIPAPIITVTQTPPDNTAFSVSIAYNDAATNAPVALSFTVS
jgi:hypothetical protein